MYEVDLQRIMDLIGRMAFTRVVGTDGERRGFDIVKDELEAFGMAAWFEEYTAPWIETGEAQVDVGAQSATIVPLAGPLFKGPWIPLVVDGGLQGVLVGDTGAECGTGARLVLRAAADPKSPCTPGAAAQVFACPPDEGFVAYYLRAVSGLGQPVPAFWVDPALAGSLSGLLGRRCRLRWTSVRSRKTLRNLVAEVRGTQTPDEVIGVTAHLDSFPGSPGANDNASGCARLVEFARWFRSHPPSRTIRFVWFTGEEAHLLDGRAYLRAYEKDKERVCLSIGVDGGVSVDQIPPEVDVCRSRALRRAAADALAEITSPGEGVVFRRAKPDESPAAASGIPEVGAPGGGRRQEHPAPYSHLPTDMVATIGRENLRVASLLGLAFIDAAQKHRPTTGCSGRLRRH